MGNGSNAVVDAESVSRTTTLVVVATFTGSAPVVAAGHVGNLGLFHMVVTVAAPQIALKIVLAIMGLNQKNSLILSGMFVVKAVRRR